MITVRKEIRIAKDTRGRDKAQTFWFVEDRHFARKQDAERWARQLNRQRVLERAVESGTLSAGAARCVEMIAEARGV